MRFPFPLRPEAGVRCPLRSRTALLGALAVCLGAVSPRTTVASPPEPGLLFHLSGDKDVPGQKALPGQPDYCSGTLADYSAGGTPVPNFEFQATRIPDGAKGAGLHLGDHQRLAYWAPGNIYAQRGTLSFFWRSQTPVGPTPFPLFRVGYADHSSWDMVFLRIDYHGDNGGGRGFDAFVTDASLARTRVSVPYNHPFPGPMTWTHLALAWDETRGIRFYVNGKLAAVKEARAVYNAGLDQFGPFARIISPYNVQSDYNFVRGGDIDEVRIYDRMLPDEAVARLALGGGAGLAPAAAVEARPLANPRWRDEWALRYGWDDPKNLPPPLEGDAVTIRKVEIHDAYDLKRWYWKACDGIRETTWPGVFNRSRLPGRNDYFQLPDWDCYTLSGKSITFHMPDEPWNQVEISGSAYGTMALVAPVPDGAPPPPDGPVLFERAEGHEKTVNRLAEPIRGQWIRFTNVLQERPIGELSAYYVHPGREPAGSACLAYRLASIPASNPCLTELAGFIAGRYAADERQTMVAVPDEGGPLTGALAGSSLPLVHILIPCNPGNPAWKLDAVDGGLDGIAIDLPPLDVKPTRGDLFPMNIRVLDPDWPLRQMFDFTFSVRPGEAKTLWLDLRDRILPPGKSLYLTLAGSGADFGPGSLAGARLRLVFKPREAARAEHELDRFTQVRDAYANLVEEHPKDDRFHLWLRFKTDLADLLRVNPNNALGRDYWAVAKPDDKYSTGKKSLPDYPDPDFTQPIPPPGVPLWAFRQVEALRHVKHFANWWIDNRQVENGEFGGGISDDTDLTNVWPGLALMGIDPDKLAKSLRLQIEAIYRQGMLTNGLCTIQADELHGYEEGLNSLGQNLILNYGSPRMIERAMETATGVEHITGVNPAGHRLFRTSYYSGRGYKMATDSVWGYTKGYSYLVMQPEQLLVEYNGNPAAKKVCIEMADGLLAHRHKDAKGQYVLPSMIHWIDDKEGQSTRNYFPWMLFWTAYKWTGDSKYLVPVYDGGTTFLAELNANFMDLLDIRKTWGPHFLANDRGELVETRVDDARGQGHHEDRVTDPEQFYWQLTGDKRWLEKLYGDQIRDMALGEYINTVGSLWIDRVGVPYTELQRARLGGIALVRNGCFPGHVVSWRFHAPSSELSAAVLVPYSTATRVKVIVYNVETFPVHAQMTGWNIDPGTWEVTQGVDTQGDDAAHADLRTWRQPFERSRSLELTFPPRAETVLTLELKTPGVPYWDRPDLGIDPEDVTLIGREVRVRVHSVGAVASPPTTVVLRSASGRILCTEQVPAIEAPTDLKPRWKEIQMCLPEGATAVGATVEIDPDHALTEITTMNNQVRL